MSEKKPLSIGYDGVIYEVKALTRVISHIPNKQTAMVVRDPNKPENEIMLVDTTELYESIVKPLDDEYIELNGPIFLMSVKDWVDSFKIKLEELV